MKKFLIVGFIFASSLLGAYAQQASTPDSTQVWDADARPQMTGRLVDGSYVGQATDITVGTAKISAQSIPAFSGRSTWYFTYFDTAKDGDIKKIVEPKAERMSVSGVLFPTVSWVAATQNCDAAASNCGLRVPSYQLTNLECGKTYKVRFHVDSLTSGKKTYSQATTFSTPTCNSTTNFSVVVSDIRKVSNNQSRVVARANISQFPGTQRVDFSAAVALDGALTSSTPFSPITSVQGEGSVNLNENLPQSTECGKMYRLILKARVGDKETTTPAAGYPFEFSCGDSTNNTGGNTGTDPNRENVYTFLTPLPLGDNLSLQEATVIGTNAGVLGILNRLFTITLIVVVALAVVFMIIGGAKYATGDTIQGKQNGRQTLTNAIIGLLFALLSWLLLNVINPDLIRFNLYLPNVGKVLTTTTTLSNGDDNSSTGSTVISGTGCGSNRTNEQCYEYIKADESRVRAELQSAGISVNKSMCPRYGATNCTMVGRLNSQTLSNVKKVKSACVASDPKCAVTITGGTEYWIHSSGGNHPKFTAVDMSLNNSTFNSFITKNGKNVGASKSCTRRFEYGGLRFCDEISKDPHWHVDTISAASSSNGLGSQDLYLFPYIGINGPKGTGNAYNDATLSARLSSTAMVKLKPTIKTIGGSDWKVLYALVAQESSGNPQAGSNKGACGLTQILPSTAKGLDSSFATLSESAICSRLKSDQELSLRLGLKYLKQGSGTMKEKLARYNGGDAALASSAHCPGRKRYECPWDAPGYYNSSNPAGNPLKPLADTSHINTGFSETRFYVINILNMQAQLKD